MTDPTSPAEHGPRVVAITGASGLIGSALSEAVRDRGDQALHLVRRDTRPADQLPEGVREATWDPGSRLDPEVLAGVHGVVHLAGAGIADKRWTDERKKVLVSSRLDGTATIADALAALGQEQQSSDAVPRLVSGSAVGFYGDRGDEVLTEESRPGEGFLSQLCQDWEAATAPAEQAGVPVAHVRTGIVLAPGGGALGRLLPLVRLGLGGPLAGGDAWWPWITLHDHVRALLFLLDHPEITGPVNLVGPAPATQLQVTRALAAELHRPAVVPAPGFALRIVLGEMSSEILSSTRVLPEVLTGAGFTFDHADLQAAAAWVVQQDQAA
ncbi:TIGR01777 family oxidoreductase [Serinicoccus marinus]|uniref:TIGR01777 family oxidoreductase n=1 Tax=Serinicoccus marinus TaxID=247333 RepID=UPI002492122F|nr:TIGR01777 family oxidoreductase [Serinicoccus marinus]